MLKDSELEDKTGTPGSVLVSGHPSDSGIVGPWILTLRLSDPGDSEEGTGKSREKKIERNLSFDHLYPLTGPGN